MVNRIRVSCLQSAVMSLALVTFAGVPAHAQPSSDVVLIIVDDLNDGPGALGGNLLTPNIDRLAARGVVFRGAHAQAPLCNPSRTSLLFGLRPDRTGLLQNEPRDHRALLPDAASLFDTFAEHGYEVYGGGKLFHAFNYLENWTEYVSLPPRVLPDMIPANGLDLPGEMDWGTVDVNDADHREAWLAAWAVDVLGKPSQSPLFLAVGFSFPHGPWYLPPGYLELFADSELPPVIADDLDDIPAVARQLADTNTHAKIVQSGSWQAAVGAYHAAVHFVDAQIGKVIDAVPDDAIVVLLSDHGFHLGEKEHWRKYNLWDKSTRVPLIWRVPGFEPRVVAHPAMLLDVYPTLTELAGISTPRGLDGRSIADVLRGSSASRPATSSRFNRFDATDPHHAIRTERWRYIRYAGDLGEELYDHANDPHEWHNIAATGEYQAVIDSLYELLRREVGMDSLRALFESTSYDPVAGTWYDESRWALDATTVDGAVAPGFDGELVTFTNSMLRVKSHPKLDAADGYGRTVDLEMRTGADVQTLQVIYDEGGTGRGVAIYLDSGRLYAGAWQMNSPAWGEVFRSTRVVADTDYSVRVSVGREFRFWVNGVLIGDPISAGLIGQHEAVNVGARNRRIRFHSGPRDDPPGIAYDHFGGGMRRIAVYGIEHPTSPSSTSASGTLSDQDRPEIFPNPFGDRLEFHGSAAPEHMRVRLFDVLGRLVRSGQGARISMDTRSLASGLYVVEVTSSGARPYRTMVVKANSG